MLTQQSLPLEIGLTPQFENNGEVVNQGFEFSVNAEIVRNQNWNWSLYANLSTLKNEVKNLKNGDIVRDYDKFSGIMRQGKELGSFYGYRIDGIFKTSADGNLKRTDGTPYQAGDYKMQDLNDDGYIDAKDRQVIGSPLPDFYGGFGTHLNYKGVELSMHFTYSLPRAAYNDPSGNFNCSDQWVEDGSYLKMKTLSLSYNIPLKKRSGFLKGLKVFANCNNLFTVTGYSGMDPEVFISNDPMLRGVDTGGSPNPRSYVFGVNISL